MNNLFFERTTIVATPRQLPVSLLDSKAPPAVDTEAQLAVDTNASSCRGLDPKALLPRSPSPHPAVGSPLLPKLPGKQVSRGRI